MIVNLLWVATTLSLISGFFLIWNLFLFRRLANAADAPKSAVSVLIPARDEEKNIAAVVESVLANQSIELEVVVMDDDSTDRTAAIVTDIAARDSRVSLRQAPPLPEGWVGKQHACYQLSQLARFPVMVFVDADVRLSIDALPRMVSHLEKHRLDFLSGFPHQVTDSFAERLLMPLIHFLLLGYLPIVGLRFTRHPAFGAGCGQLIATRSQAYRKTGGHKAIRQSMHDGIMLPRAFRKAGLRTDMFDADDLAKCRMYSGYKEVWRGLSKNATEGMATPIGLPIWTVLLFGGHVLAFLLSGFLLFMGEYGLALWALAIAVFSIDQRLAVSLRFRQSMLGTALHPFGICVILAIQWLALIDAWHGRPPQWRGRSYASK